MHLRFGSSLYDQQQGSGDQQNQSRQWSRLGKEPDAQANRNDGARHETEFVHHGFEGEGGAQLRFSDIDRHPPGADHRADRRGGAAGDDQNEKQPIGSFHPHCEQERPDRRDAHGCGNRQDRTLSEAVDRT